jgi:hypothetical protein
LSQQSTSLGSCLHLRTGASFQLEESVSADVIWPEEDYWIIGRELLLYQLIDLSGVPGNLRLKVLGQKVRQFSPFEQPGHCAIHRDDAAMVWMWDESARQIALNALVERQSNLAGHVQKLRPLPEALLHPCLEHGEVTQTCFSGSDRQKWHQNKLVSSQWMPSSVAAGNMQLLAEPWGERKSVGFFDERLLARGGVLVFAAIILFQLGTMSRLLWASNELEQDLSSSGKEVSEVLALREKVRVMKKENGLLVSWFSTPSQIAILADFDELLTPSTVGIVNWDYQNGDLKVTVEDENLDNRAYVESLSEGVRFSEVGVEPGIAKNTAVIRLKVVR